MDALDIALKVGAFILIPLAVAAWWTGAKLWRGDQGAFEHAKWSHPRFVDILLGRMKHQPANRADAPASDGVVTVKRKGRRIWILNRRMSDEQYDRLTR